MHTLYTEEMTVLDRQVYAVIYHQRVEEDEEIETIALLLDEADAVIALSELNHLLGFYDEARGKIPELSEDLAFPDYARGKGLDRLRKESTRSGVFAAELLRQIWNLEIDKLLEENNHAS